MKREKQFLSLALVLVIVLTLFPMTVMASTEPYSPTISMGLTHNLLIKEDNSLWRWGVNDEDLTKIMDNVEYAATGGRSASFAVKTDHTLWVWGEFSMNTDYGSTPTKIMDDVATVSVGETFYAVIKTDASLWIMGETARFMSPSAIAEPVKIADNVAAVACNGLKVLLFIKTDGSLWCMGNDSDFYGGMGTPSNNAPVKLMDGVAKVVVHATTMVLKTDGTLWTYGRDSYKTGYLGTGTYEQKSPVKIMDDVQSISWCAAVKKDGSLWRWGNNVYGAVGNGRSGDPVNTPLKVLDGVASVTADNNGALALKTDGTLWAWGKASAIGVGGYSDPPVLTPSQYFSGVLVPTISTSTPAESTQPPTPASNTPSSWAQAQVTAAIAAKLVPQNLQSKYTQATTRAEFCALAVALYETYTGKEITDRKTFDDTKDMNVEKMAAVGVVSGTGNNKFSPDNQLTREQAAVMLARLADAIGKPLTKQAATFADNGSVSSWALEGVGQVQAAGIMSGTGNNMFSPQNPYTREQSIITIMRLFDAVK